MAVKMANTAQRNNIKPMLTGIAGVMVVPCLFATGACERRGRNDLARANCMVYGILGLFSFRILFSPRLYTIAVDGFPRFGVRILLAHSLDSIRRVVLFTAGFAGKGSAIFCVAVLIKFRDRFNFLASRALLRYDGLEHGFFLYKKLCLEPLQT